MRAGAPPHASSQVMIYSRAGRFGYVVYHVVDFLRTNGGTSMFVGSCCATACMSVLNLAFCLDATGKLVKFLKMDTKSKDLQETANALLVSTTGIHGAFQLTRAKANWGKLKGLYRMGSFQTRKKN